MMDIKVTSNSINVSLVDKLVVIFPKPVYDSVLENENFDFEISDSRVISYPKIEQKISLVLDMCINIEEEIDLESDDCGTKTAIFFEDLKINED